MVPLEIDEVSKTSDFLSQKVLPQKYLEIFEESGEAVKKLTAPTLYL
jgi:hypothetical protein